MWDLRYANPIGRISMRRFLVHALAVLLAIFSVNLLLSPSASAATWRGEAIVYEDRQYSSMGTISSDSPSDLPEGATYYTSLESNNTDDDAVNDESIAHVIYFPPDTDVTTATSATYAQFEFVPPDAYINPSGETAISITEQSESGQSATSCDSTFTFGIGWIICPVTNFLASAMDWLFDILTSFLEVRPAQTGQENTLYRAWSFMRNFANVAFVIAFLILIYSQITSIGLSNYGIKKMLPRLVVAAVLVNISYWICAIAIDVFNILGYSLQDLFIGMRNSLVGGSGNSWDLMSWHSISSFILAGGTITLGGGVAAAGLIASAGIGGALYLLLPILVGVLLAVIVALLVLAVRQAIITILVIVAPLAFVAFLLPNTEKYFERWRDLFLTMLMVFPMFSVIFGGSQLAGLAIIQNANSINMVLLGMAVQVAPVVITPILIRVSGSLVGRIAGMVNNPNRGIINNARNFAQERSKQHKDQVLARPNPRGLNRVTQRMDTSRRKREAWQRTNQTRAENNFRQSEGYEEIEMASREADRTKQTIDNQLDKTWNVKAQIDPDSLEKELKLHVSSDEASHQKARVESLYEEAKAGSRENLVFGPQTRQMTDVLNRAEDTQTLVALEGMRKKAAQRVQENNTGDVLLNNSDASEDLIDRKRARDYAGGIRGQEGADTALTQAVAAQRKEFNELVGEKQQLMKHFGLSTAQYQDLAMDRDVTTSRGGVDYTFTSADAYNKEGAITHQMKSGSATHIRQIIAESGASADADGEILLDSSGQQMKDASGRAIRKGKTYDFRSTVQDEVTANGIPGKQLIFGSKIIDDIGQGKFHGDKSLTDAAVFHIMEGKINDEVLSRQDPGTLEILYETTNNVDKSELFKQATEAQKQAFRTNHARLRQSATRIIDPANTDYNPAAASADMFKKYSTPIDEPNQ